MFVVAGLLSAVIARYILGLVGRADDAVMIVLAAPVVEEVSKTGLALLWGADVFLVHIVFGGTELFSDSLGGRGIWPGLAALVLHSLLGFGTAWLLMHAGVTVALALAIVLHGLWNYTAVRLL
ncbi:hypothetical protein [Desulfoscipio gibsoniae]|uniref:CAAX amino terminal protease family n=1 Tax=Desulfoscipio gibsoniae DSM 7213 TaxID=767817 RepID=R4KB07_9FIRM|nr:hypothetical protein [Desulfoscipio gibsoniae]AGK99753.1 hypothetical protein Desgi_0140 [Desulfoscipio gibsoniae DSM 7213]